MPFHTICDPEEFMRLFFYVLLGLYALYSSRDNSIIIVMIRDALTHTSLSLTGIWWYDKRIPYFIEA